MTKGAPLITIIIPMYGVEAYIRPCLDSVLNQTYANIEVLCVDDGSPDACGQIASRYAKVDSRFKVISKANGGLSDARNAGLDVANGDYVFLLDGDDVIEPSCISDLTAIAKEHDADIVACDYFQFADKADQAEVKAAPGLLHGTGRELYSMSYSVPALKIPLNTAWGKIYRRDLFCGIRYPKGVLHEDEFTTYKLFFRAQRAYYTPTRLYGYRQRPQSIMRSRYSMERLAAIDAMEERLLFFILSKEDNLIDAALEEYLASAMNAYKQAADAQVGNAAHERYKKGYRNYRNRMNWLSRARHLVFYWSPSLHAALVSAIQTIKGRANHTS